MTTTTPVEMRREPAGPGEWVSPRLPDMIDGWVRDGLVSAHLAMKVFSPTLGAPDTRDAGAGSSHARYFGAGIITLGGLLILLDNEVGFGTGLLVGVLTIIALRNALRPAPAFGRRGSHPTPPRHRNVRRLIRKDRP